MSLTEVVSIGIEIAVGITIETEKNYHSKMFDPEKPLEKHQTLMIMTLIFAY